MIVGGGALLLFRRRFGQLLVISHEKTWGIHSGPAVVRAGEVMAALVGACAAIIGVLKVVR